MAPNVLTVFNLIARFGGDGGSYTHSIDIPEGYRLFGFYGGTA